jgi:four helix bundle protein
VEITIGVNLQQTKVNHHIPNHMDYSEKNKFVEGLKSRTKAFAISIILLCRKLPNAPEYNIIKGQLIRASSSVSSNYRAASWAISTKSMYSKMKIDEEEADETQYWLEVLDEIWPKEEKNRVNLTPYLKEAGELLSIFLFSAMQHPRSILG